MGGLFQNGINRKYFCGFGCGCEALTIGAATDAASATAATTIIVTAIVTAVSGGIPRYSEGYPGF